MSEIKKGFQPVYDLNSKVLILGSFPSVKSRKVEFYYGNKQNRFWKTICGYFGEEIPETTEGKKAFCLKNNIALWDIVTECEIEGSKDSSIKNYKIADLKIILQNCKLRVIILNGSTAFSIFEKFYKGVGVPYIKLPSTSPANTRFDLKEWHDALSRAFGQA